MIRWMDGEHGEAVRRESDAERQKMEETRRMTEEDETLDGAKNKARIRRTLQLR